MALLTDNLLKVLVNIGCKPERLSKKNEDQIAALLQQKIQSSRCRSKSKAAVQENFFMLFRLYPHFAYSLLIVIIALVCLGTFFSAFNFINKRDILPSALVVISEFDNSSPDSKKEQTPGKQSYGLKSGETVHTLPNRMAYLQFKDQALINLMPNTELTFTQFDHVANRCYFKLQKGAFYFKTEETKETSVSLVIQINNYSFLLTAVPVPASDSSVADPENIAAGSRKETGRETGTEAQGERRAYFELADNESIKVVCYAGGLQMQQVLSGTASNLETAAAAVEVAPTALKIVNGQLLKNYRPDEWSAEERSLDEVFAHAKLLSPQGLEALVLLNREAEKNQPQSFEAKLSVADLDKLIQNQMLSAQIKSIIARQNKRTDNEDLTFLPEARLPDATKARYAKQLISVLTNATSGIVKQNSKVNFYGALAEDDFACLVSQDEGWILKGTSLLPIHGLPAKPFFKMRPFLSGKNVSLLAMNTLFLIDPDTAQVTQKIPLLAHGICIDNYYPLYEQGAIYFAMQNIGYCTLRFNSNKLPAWQTVFAEPFPLAPLAADGRLLVGSYYNNYLASIDHSGKLIWKYTFNGRNFSNPVIKADKEGPKKFLVYTADNNSYKIMQLNQEKGNKEKEWALNEAIYTDFIYFSPYIIGIDVKGYLFSINTNTGASQKIASITRNNLTMSEWRNVNPLISGQYLYQGTERGTLIIYNLLTAKVEDEITVDAKSAFFTSPFKVQNQIYLISNDGTIYRVSGF